MDDRLKAALDFANYSQSFAIQKKILKEKIEAKLTYGIKGGIFKIDRSLITYVQMLIDQGRADNIPLIDSNGNPILIENLIDFRDEILDRYFSSSVEYYEKFEEMKKNRTIEKLVDL
jgi:hypothetical protein